MFFLHYLISEKSSMFTSGCLFHTTVYSQQQLLNTTSFSKLWGKRFFSNSKWSERWNNILYEHPYRYLQLSIDSMKSRVATKLRIFVTNNKCRTRKH